MHRLTLVLLLAFTCVVSINHAQDPARFRLRVPTAEEYVAEIVEIAFELEQSPNSPVSSFFNALSTVLFYLYPDVGDIGFDALHDAYTVIGIGRRDLVDRGTWSRRMVMTWITENAVDLSRVDELEFQDFSVVVTPRDFNADGVDEYLLDIVKGERMDRHTDDCFEPEVMDYLVIQLAAEEYRAVDTNLPWRGRQSWGYSPLSGRIAELRFEDLNADGLPEWVVLVGGELLGGPQMGYADSGGLLVLGWRDDGLEFLVPTLYSRNNWQGEATTDFSSPRRFCGSLFPLTVSWEFTNIDGDDALEILQSEQYSDNWHCRHTETKIFDWNPEADRYIHFETRIEFADTSQNCTQRRAEEIMWAGDYAAAIPLLERALTLEILEPVPHNRDRVFANDSRSMNQYLRARLALAYLLTKQGQMAIPLLETLAAEYMEDETIGLLVETLRVLQRSEASPLKTCVEVYNLFTEHFPEIRVGYTDDDVFYGDPLYIPENVGCDAPTMLREFLSSTVIPVDNSPVDFLADLGIETLKSLETDMNGDGQSEWLVWPRLIGVEVFFAPNGGNFRVSYPNLDPFRVADVLTAWQLPEGAGSALALILFDWQGRTIPPWWFVYVYYGGLSGEGPFCMDDDFTIISNTGEFSLWQLRDAELTRIFFRSQCAKQLETIFPDGKGSSELHSFERACLDQYCDTSTVVEKVYLWDEQAKTYIVPPAEVTPQPTQTLSPTSTPHASVFAAFRARDFEMVINMSENPPDVMQSSELVFADRYLRALAFEALNRPDEALAEYVTIYQAAPESPWGKLAALHIEPVE